MIPYKVSPALADGEERGGWLAALFIGETHTATAMVFRKPR